MLVAAGPGAKVLYRYDDTALPKDAPRGCWQIARSGACRPGRSVAAIEVPVVSRVLATSIFLVPGLLGMNLMGSGVWGVGFAIVDAAHKKLMKRLIATPMPRHYYLLSFLFYQLLLLVLEVGTLLTFAVLVFQVPVRFMAGSGGVVCGGFPVVLGFGIA